MNPYLAELLGTMLLVLFGDGVVANVVLSRIERPEQRLDRHRRRLGGRRHDRGLRRERAERRALEPRRHDRDSRASASSSGRACPATSLAQTVGAFLGGVLVWLTYLPHWPLTEDKGAKLAVFSTGPAVRWPLANLLSEAIATAALVLGLLSVLTPKNLVPNSGFETGLAPLLVGVIVFAIGLSLGGSTGYAINPARDLGPRLAHLLLPIPGKGSSDWGYAWVPVIGPIIGGVVGAWVYVALWTA